MTVILFSAGKYDALKPLYYTVYFLLEEASCAVAMLIKSFFGCRIKRSDLF